MSDASSLDLSERHLIYFTYHTQPDPLGNTAGDASIAVNSSLSYDPYLERGSSYTYPEHALASWMGAVGETSAPTYAELLSLHDSGEFADEAEFVEMVALDPTTSHALNSYHLTGSLHIAMSDVEDVKRAVMENGAVGISYKSSSSYYNSSWYNGRRARAYYAPAIVSGGHAVSLVGWDDDFPVNNFKSGTRPSTPGAWLVKSSWGTTSTDDGYLWISYEDAAFKSDSAKAFVFMAEPAENLDNIYQYDGTAGDCYNAVGSGGAIANVFEARANAGGAELLEAVSFSLVSVNVGYEVQVYRNPTVSGNPTSGTLLLGKPVVGGTTYAGYYTVDLPEPVLLEEGDTFSVVVTLSRDDGSDVGYEADCTYGAGDRYGSTLNWAHHTNHVEPGQSFERDGAGAAWDDLSLATYDENDEPCCSACLKAFTTNTDAPVNPFLDVSRSTAHYEDIIWLYERGITRGWEVPGGLEFRPYNQIKRADMAAFLYRMAGEPEYEPTTADRAFFTDVTDETPHAKEIWWLASKGISQGWAGKGGTHTFRPYNNVKRCDMAAFLMRMALDDPDAESHYTPDPAFERYFLDIGIGSSHRTAVLWLAEQGISRGWDAIGGRHEFRPYNDVARADMAAFLHRM